MLIPIHFEDLNAEIEAYSDYAVQTYQRAAATSSDTLTPDKMFQSLFDQTKRLVTPAEYEDQTDEEVIAMLRSRIDYAFKKSPHLAAAAIEQDLNNFHRPTDVHTTVISDVQPLTQALYGNAFTYGGHSFNEERQETKPAVEQREYNNQKISPYQVTQVLLKQTFIRIVGEALFVFDGGFYRHLTPECLKRLIMEYCRNAVAAAGSARMIEEVYRLILCEPCLVHREEDEARNLICFDNGILDLDTGTLLPHDHKYLTFFKVNCEWKDHPERHPAFERFLHLTSGGDALLEQRIYEMLGYCLAPDTRGKCFFLLQGVPNSGKSLLAQFIRGCLTRETCTALDITTLGNRFAAAELVGKQLCLSLDLPAGPLNARMTGTFKSITGGDPITADVKYSPHVTFTNRAKFILATNHALTTQMDDPAFFDRVVTIPFQYSIPRDQQDRNLLDRLNCERAAIVRDAIMAYQALRARNYIFAGNFPINGCIATATVPATGISSNTDAAVSRFLIDFCEPAPGAFVFVEDLHDEFYRQFPGAYLPENRFTGVVLAACAGIGLSVEKGERRRKEGHKNPQATLRGLHLKNKKTC